MIQYAFYFDSARCTGCKTCELACKDYKDVSTELTLRKVFDMEGGGWEQNPAGAWVTNAFVYHLSIACNHCEDPACVQNCPTGAMTKDAETGLVWVNEDECIGCGTCALACPYEAPKINKDLGVSRKCDGCRNRVGEGDDPVCVAACPLRALEFGDYDELVVKHGESRDVFPLPSSDMTHPHIVVGNSPALDDSVYSGARIGNELELV